VRENLVTKTPVMITEMTKEVHTVDGAATKAMEIFRLLLQDYHPRDFAISFWDGSRWPAENGTARFTLMVRHPDALRRMLKTNANDLSLSEAYISGDLEVEGDLEAAMPVANYLIGRNWPAVTMLRIGKSLLRLPRLDRLRRKSSQPVKLSGQPHSMERDRQAVSYHYDVSNDFYALWLDEQMVYSCAYFATADEDLEAAQARKLDYLCRKLRLRPGERLLVQSSSRNPPAELAKKKDIGGPSASVSRLGSLLALRMTNDLETRGVRYGRSSRPFPGAPSPPRS